jgi:hypothetical protein
MKSENRLQGYMENLNRMPFNAKAEIIVSQLLERGLSSEKILIHLNGAFNRPFRRDIESAQLGIGDEQDQINLFLSRNGIYDLLPEGISHQRTTGKGKENIQQLIQIFQKQKREEKEARRFFKPFENELFAISVKLEQQEAALLKNQDNQFQEFLLRFWDVDLKLSKCQKEFLLKIAPLAYSIKGNIAKICKLLQVFLDKPVSYEKRLIPVTVEPIKKQKDFILGHNFIVGNITEELPVIRFEIDDLEENCVKDYLKGAPIYNFINEFLEYLLPLEYELEITCKTNMNHLCHGFGVLGYSSVLKS